MRAGFGWPREKSRGESEPGRGGEGRRGGRRKQRNPKIKNKKNVFFSCFFFFLLQNFSSLKNVPPVLPTVCVRIMFIQMVKIIK